MRTLLALSIALGVGVAPSALAGAAPAGVAPATGATAVAAVPASADVDVTVEQTPLVVVPEAEAAPEPSAASSASPSAAPSASPSAAPSAGPSAGAEPSADAAEEPAAEPSPAPAESVDPAAGTVVADVLEAGRVLTPAVETTEAQTVGVTWPEGADATGLEPQVRSLTDGEWSDWVVLGMSDAEPDAGTADAANAARGGTDSYWVGEAEAVQLSFAATANGGPADLSLALVASDEDLGATGTTGTGAAAAEGAASAGEAVVRTAAYRTSAAAAVVPAAASQPAVVTRAQWGARNQVCAPDVASRLEGAVVHHTAGSNSYTTQAQAIQQIRNDQAYHIDARRWCDIGYNFIVDKWGTIYEGRANSLTQAVIGVHATNANTGTVGVSMLGNYDTVPTTPAMIDSVGRIIGWRLAAYGVNPLGAGTYPSGLYLPRVIGHRDVAQTACPGRYGYAQLGTIRNIASVSGPAMPLSDARAITSKLYQDMLGRPVDQGGLTSWSAAMVGGMAPAQVATGLATSAEYAYAAVDRAYRDVLGRAPDPTGIATWTAAIMDGRMRSEDLRIWLFGSVEYFNISGQTNDRYVAALYSKMLGRTASASDIAFWSPLVASKGKDAVVRGFWQSMESANIRVQAFYQQYLGRGADAAGMATWPPVLLARGEGELRSQIVGSLEYRNQAVAKYV
ncbi:DUF4214 domain-containing protein [Cellulomonas sp. ACRRI]|uniref:DUF4214 domain-containing protein n=1 Tax=Cellulomonas sp. ACRRI TaxID=2918188 RepID=UPI001EF31AEB|nr:DUF4214 domain-containing protein [Cellulomonas sp. ACRRI]MCG7285440.1 DUF4214 domain-containing protein [Cellulomonas sp. ACRRI]